MNEWTIYGQEGFVTGAVVDDPKANLNGVVGEQQLPYIVPDGYKLHITAYGVEAYDTAGTIVLVPWIGEFPANNSKCLHSCGSNSGSSEVLGFQAVIPAGKKLHARMMCGESPRQVCSWYLRGYLEPAALP